MTAFSPLNGAIGVRSQPLTATFGRAMSATTITSGTIQLATVSGTSVSTSVSYDADTRTVTLTPDSALTPLTEYRVTVVGGSEGVSSLAGATLSSATTWTFKTAASSLIAQWSLNDGSGALATDVSGNGNDGVIVGEPA